MLALIQLVRCIELAHANQELAAELDIAGQKTQLPAEQHGLLLRLKKAERERDLLRREREERTVASVSLTGEDSQQAITQEFIKIGKERDQLRKVTCCVMFVFQLIFQLSCSSNPKYLIIKSAEN